MSGAGNSPFGVGPYGVGTPVTAPNPGRAVLVGDDGQPKNARKIDPVTGDYVCDDFGRYMGMDATEQLVLLAVATDYGSSAVQTLGNKIKNIQDITQALEREVDTTYREALADLVSRKRIEVVDITTERIGNSGAFVRVKWRDLENNVERETTSLGQ